MQCAKNVICKYEVPIYLRFIRKIILNFNEEKNLISFDKQIKMKSDFHR